MRTSLRSLSMEGIKVCLSFSLTPTDTKPSPIAVVFAIGVGKVRRKVTFYLPRGDRGKVRVSNIITLKVRVRLR